MSKAIAAAMLTIASVWLGGCGSGGRDATDTIDRAEGEILDRSVSDDMLPYDTLRSQPPLADPEEAEKADKDRRAVRSGTGTSTQADEAPLEPQAAVANPGGGETRPDAE